MAALALVLAAVLALTWRRWGAPEIDPGLDLTVADLMSGGSVP